MKYIGKKYKVNDNSYAVNLSKEKLYPDLAPCGANNYKPSPILTITTEPFEITVEFAGKRKRTFVIVEDGYECSYFVLFDKRNVL